MTINSSEPFCPHPSAQTVVRQLRDVWPTDTPFLALGQTALWDEPTKAVFRRILDNLWPDARMIAAAHDTDYFAKLPTHRADGDAKYALVGHDDARTRGLWSAAGEMSRLFGSEDVTTVADLQQKAGVVLPRALFEVADPLATLGQMTETWGWTGILNTEATSRRTVSEIPLADILPTLLGQIETTVADSLACIESDLSPDATVALATMRSWIGLFAERNPNATLPDLYRDLFPRLYELLLSSPAANLATTSTTRLLRFNRQTCSLPRFAFVDLFLNTKTRQYAENSYNLALAGSDIYTLDQFGEGALPFELHIPGRGRGTIFLTNRQRTLTIETPQPIVLNVDSPIGSIQELADVVETNLGENVTLLGKAVSLLPMLCAEHFLLFHEGASGYSDRTRAMLAHLKRYGVAFGQTLRPIVRLRYATWDALTVLDDDVTFCLPPHLMQSFGRETITAGDFGNCWQIAMRHAATDLATIAELRSPRRWLEHLARSAARGGKQSADDFDGADWGVCATEHETARMKLLTLWNDAQAIQGRIYTLYDQVRTLSAQAVALERRKGDDFRARVQPLREQLAEEMEVVGNEEDPAATTTILQQTLDSLQAERAVTFDAEIEALRAQAQYARQTVRDLRDKRLAIERGDDAQSARLTMKRIEAKAEREKARQARNALQTLRGLPHTNNRPSAWWFPAVDPSGRWLARVAETTQAYLEPLDGRPAE